MKEDNSDSRSRTSLLAGTTCISSCSTYTGLCSLRWGRLLAERISFDLAKVSNFELYFWQAWINRCRMSLISLSLAVSVASRSSSSAESKSVMSICTSRPSISDFAPSAVSEKGFDSLDRLSLIESKNALISSINDVLLISRLYSRWTRSLGSCAPEVSTEVGVLSEYKLRPEICSAMQLIRSS